MNFLLLDTYNDWKNLLPLTYFTKIANIRIGIFKIYEKWERRLKMKSLVLSEDYLGFPPDEKYELVIRSVFLPDQNLVQAIKNLQPGEALKDQNGEWIAARFKSPVSVFDREKILSYSFDFQTYKYSVIKIQRPYELILLNAREIVKDFSLSGVRNNSGKGIQIIGEQPFFVHESAKLHGVYMDLSEGPVYIDKDVTVLPGTYIKGPAAILNHSFVKAGTSIYNGTTLGPWTKVGGEIKNVLFQGYSNKGHDGFLGDSVVGKWCNFGAGTSNSNLKNNYSEIRMWHIASRKFEPTGQMFLGTVMGDFSKTAINTRLNTGTVIGAASNIFASGFPPKFVPSFNWGGTSGEHDYLLEPALETARIVYKRRNVDFGPQEEAVFRHVFELVKRLE